MIRIKLLLACTLLSQSLFAADMPLKSSIASVTVYLAGAQVTRTAQVNFASQTQYTVNIG